VRVRRGASALIALTAIMASLVLLGCGLTATSTSTSSIPRHENVHRPASPPLKELTVNSAIAALRRLPYGLHVKRLSPSGAPRGAFVGQLVAHPRLFLRFAVAVGKGRRIAAPWRNAYPRSAYKYPRFGFTWLDDLELKDGHGSWHRPRRMRDLRLWGQSIEMSIAAQEALCQAARQKPCPISVVHFNA
jgi:hypothetical protein